MSTELTNTKAENQDGVEVKGDITLSVLSFEKEECTHVTFVSKTSVKASFNRSS